MSEFKWTQNFLEKNTDSRADAIKHSIDKWQWIVKKLEAILTSHSGHIEDLEDLEDKTTGFSCGLCIYYGSDCSRCGLDESNPSSWGCCVEYATFRDSLDKAVKAQYHSQGNVLDVHLHNALVNAQALLEQIEHLDPTEVED